jgi:Cu2+-containing amine oxidase
VTCFVVAGPSKAGDDPANPNVLTPAEKDLVNSLAEQALKEKGLLQGKTVLTSLEVFRDSRDKVSDRRVLAIHYRYDGDLALLTSIDLGRKKVLRVQEMPHMPTSLAPEEFVLAEKLARADPAVAKVLAGYGQAEKIEADSLAHFTADPEAPGHHHRVVRLMFRQGRTYLLYGPMVDVDLTTGQVRLEYQDARHKP